MLNDQKTFRNVLHRFMKAALSTKSHRCHKQGGKKLKIWMLKSGALPT